MDSIDLRSLDEELANLDSEDLRFLSKFVAEYSPTIHAENSPTIQRKIKTLLEEPIPEGVNKKLKALLKPSKPIPIPPPRNRNRNRNRKQETLLDIFDPIRPNRVKTVTDYQNEIKDLYEDTEYAGVEETSGRRYKRWRIVAGLNKDLTPRFMEKIRENVGTSFYMRHVYAYLLVNIENGNRLTFYRNKGSPWMKTYADAEKWIKEREEERLDSDNIDRPDTKWVIDTQLESHFFTVDLKVVQDRQPLVGTGPLPNWLRNRAHAARGQAMVALDQYRDNLCLWRCIAVHKGARPDRSTEAARDLAKSFYKLRNTPNDLAKTSLEDLEKVETHLNKGKALAEWAAIRVYIPELINENEIEFGLETCPRIVWHLMRNPPTQIKNIITIGVYGDHAFLIKDIAKLANVYECNHCHARFTQACHLQKHAERCSQGKTVIHCPGEKVEAPQTAYQKAFYPKHQASKESIQWLRYVEKNWKFKIAHAMSGHGGERWIEKRPVDGYNDEKKVVFQYQGCRWHGCPKCYPDRNQIIERDKTAEDLYQATKRRTAHLRKRGYKVIECWSCQWLVPGGADKHGEELPKPGTKAYPHAILYDFEAYGATNQRKEPTNFLTIESKHIPVSVSIGDTLETEVTQDGKKVPKVTHICERNPKVLVRKFMQELGRREKNIRKQVRAEYMPADVNLIPKDQRKKIEEWCDQVPTLGFNSGTYDLNLIKNYFVKELADTANKVRVAKSGSKIMFLLTDRLRFLDIINYLGPGTSYERWVKAYDCKATKSWLPYEWFDREEKLDYEGLPEYEHWYSKLKKEYVLTREEWEGCKQVFKEKGMKTFKDWLEYYNNLDVAPGLEALEKMKAFYIEKGIDILKDAVSIPGVSLHYLLKGAIERKAELYAPRKEAYGMLKGAVVGGPSLVFTRYHEAGKTRIRSHQYPDSKLCENIQGYDANALYLSTMLNYMPCGKEKVVHYTAHSREHQTNNPDQANHLNTNGVDHLTEQVDEEQEAADFTQRLKQKSWFGYAEVDIEIPEHLHQKFEEMCPFFHKKAVPANVVPEHMKEYLKATGRKAVESNKKLLGTLSAEKILLYEPLLQWYINHGAEIKRVYRTIDYKPKKIFEWFVKEVTEARRTGDVDKSKALLADIFKLLGNSGYGKLIEALERQTNVIYTKDEKVVDRALRSAYFEDLDEIGAAYELESRKPRITIRRPFQIGIAVYQLAKLRMLQFYYDFLDRYLDRKDFELIQMDTDSNYLAISGKTLEEIVKPEMKAEFEQEKKNWLAWDKWSGRTPGLFKKEFEGERMIALCSKCYYAEHQTGNQEVKKKLSSKGMSKRQNEINWQRFKAALEGSKDMATNRGFRMRDGNMVTYEQEKLGLSAYYDKRWVLPDGIHTEPIEYHV